VRREFIYFRNKYFGFKLICISNQLKIKRMRLSITFIFIFCISLVMAQSYNAGGKIDDEDKRRLENQFKALNTFYINDEGLVVYQNKGNQVSVVEEYKEDSYSDEPSTVKSPSKEYSEGSSTESPSVSRDGTPVRTRPVISKDRNISNVTSSGNESRKEEVIYPPVENNRNERVSAPAGRPSSINKRPVSPVYVNKSPGAPAVNSSKPQETSSDIVVEKVTIPEEKDVLSTSTSTATPTPTSKSKPPIALGNATAERQEIPADTVPAKPSIFSKKSIFGSEPAKYKDLEEAAWAAQELLEKLRSEHPKAKNSGSLSSSISRGAGRASLRKRNSSSGNMAANSASRMSTGSNRPIISEETREAEIRYERAANEQPIEGEPTYFLNGIQVDKSVINKLKGSDILRKERRVRNTVSGNPVGEIWYEVK